jgi:hypothetical protein
MDNKAKNKRTTVIIGTVILLVLLPVIVLALVFGLFGVSRQQSANTAKDILEIDSTENELDNDMQSINNDSDFNNFTDEEVTGNDNGNTGGELSDSDIDSALSDIDKSVDAGGDASVDFADFSNSEAGLE